jgi:hypothetical protein
MNRGGRCIFVPYTRALPNLVEEGKLTLTRLDPWESEIRSMMPLAVVDHQAPVPPPAYQRALARLGPALHIDALTLVTTLHLLLLCRLAVHLAQRRCQSPLSAGPGGAPWTYSEESLLLIALLRTLWRLSYQDMRDWLRGWPALALACGLPLGKDGCPRIPCPSQQCKRGKSAGVSLPEALFILSCHDRHPLSADWRSRPHYR